MAAGKPCRFRIKWRGAQCVATLPIRLPGGIRLESVGECTRARAAARLGYDDPRQLAAILDAGARASSNPAAFYRTADRHLRATAEAEAVRAAIHAAAVDCPALARALDVIDIARGDGPRAEAARALIARKRAHVGAGAAFDLSSMPAAELAALAKDPAGAAKAALSDAAQSAAILAASSVVPGLGTAAGALVVGVRFLAGQLFGKKPGPKDAIRKVMRSKKLNEDQKYLVLQGLLRNALAVLPKLPKGIRKDFRRKLAGPYARQLAKMDAARAAVVPPRPAPPKAAPAWRSRTRTAISRSTFRPPPDSAAKRAAAQKRKKIEARRARAAEARAQRAPAADTAEVVRYVVTLKRAEDAATT